MTNKYTAISPTGHKEVIHGDSIVQNEDGIEISDNHKRIAIVPITWLLRIE